MPTAGRLFAAIAFAIIGGYFAYRISPLFDEGQEPSFWYPLCVLAGVWAGWVVVGKRAGRGYSAAISNGLTGVAAQFFWIIFIVAFFDMINKSMRRSYDGPVEAVVNVFQLGMEYVMEMGSIELGLMALGAGAAGGVFAEYFAQRMP